MTSPGTVVPLLVFEAADCLMAIVASEVGHLEKGLREPFSREAGEKGPGSLRSRGLSFALARSLRRARP